MPYETVIKSSKRIERLLSGLGATGKGLHEKATSVEDLISDTLVRKIRYLASVRNKLIHEDGYELTELELYKFKLTTDEVCEILSIDNEAVPFSEEKNTYNYKETGPISVFFKDIFKSVYRILYGVFILFVLNSWFN